jgi:hypothetical protein
MVVILHYVFDSKGVTYRVREGDAAGESGGIKVGPREGEPM